MIAPIDESSIIDNRTHNQTTKGGEKIMSNGNDEARQAELKKKKLAKLLGEFSADELGGILTEELDATTRRKIKGGGGGGDPVKTAMHTKLSGQIDKADTENIASWVAGKDSRSCSLNGPSPEGMDDGKGGTYDKMSIIFRFSSEAIRKENLDARKAANAE